VSPAQRPTGRPAGANATHVPEPSDQGRAHRHLAKLYQVSTLLTRFESFEVTVPSVIGKVAEAIGLRSAVLILEHDRRRELFAWHVTSLAGGAIDAVKERATRAYSFFQRPRADRTLDESGTFQLPQLAVNDHDGSQFVLLPLGCAPCPAS